MTKYLNLIVVFINATVTVIEAIQKTKKTK
jgi:hypothetical protein